MSKHDHKQCYGTMFPPILRLEADKIVSGKVFSFEIVRAGGTFASHRRIATNMQEWNDCLECSEFEHCYKLSTGRLALEAAIAGQKPLPARTIFTLERTTNAGRRD